MNIFLIAKILSMISSWIITGKSYGATKKKILGTIFAEKLIVENGKITAPTYTESIKLIFRIGKSIGNSKGNKEVDIDLKFLGSYQN